VETLRGDAVRESAATGRRPVRRVDPHAPAAQDRSGKPDPVCLSPLGASMRRRQEPVMSKPETPYRKRALGARSLSPETMMMSR